METITDDWRKPQYHDTTAAYILPNDSPEHQRLEVQAQAFEQLMHGKIFHAPLASPRRILDIGCGTGRTTIQLATKYPDARVIGIDLSPVPAIHRKPANVDYIQGDFLQLARSGDERFKAGSFDYIFHRLLVFGITDWTGYFSDVASLLASGGCVEAHDTEITTRDADDSEVGMNEALEVLRHLASSKGMDMDIGRNLRGYMKECGLEDVQEQMYRIPLLPEPEHPETEMIQQCMVKVPISIQSIWDRLGSGVYPVEKLDELRDILIKAWKPEALHKGDHVNFHVVWSRKALG